MIYYLSVICLLLMVLSAVCYFLFLKSSKKEKKLNRNINQLEKDFLNLETEFTEYRQSRKLNNVFERLVEQSPNAIMVMDKNAQILSVNKGFTDLYEYSFESFTKELGTNYRQTSFNADVDYRLNWVNENKKPYRYEALNVTQSGKEIWTQTALMPILDRNNEVIHYVTIDTDIHQRYIMSENLVDEMIKLNQNIDDMSIQFKSLEQESGNLFESITELYALIDNTHSILSFIKSISDETRILGFNASIEAARAGEYGTGFRVITNKIVDISHNTIESVGKISNIINSINQKQKELIVNRDDSFSQMKEYEHTISTLKEMVIHVEKSIDEFKSLA